MLSIDDLMNPIEDPEQPEQPGQSDQPDEPDEPGQPGPSNQNVKRPKCTNCKFRDAVEGKSYCQTCSDSNKRALKKLRNKKKKKGSVRNVVRTWTERELLTKDATMT